MEGRGPHDAAAQVPARPGAIILARHGEPALSRRCKLTSAEYRAWWDRYEEGGLLPGQVPPDHLKSTANGCAAVLASVRPRALETARALMGDRAFDTDALFIEAPLPPPRFPDWIRLSPRNWGGVARFWWWFFDHHEGQERRHEAEARARAAADILIDRAKGGDVLLLAHGFFNAMIGQELKKRGWRVTLNEGFKYWSARRFEKR